MALARGQNLSTGGRRFPAYQAVHFLVPPIGRIRPSCWHKLRKEFLEPRKHSLEPRKCCLTTSLNSLAPKKYYMAHVKCSLAPRKCCLAPRKCFLAARKRSLAPRKHSVASKDHSIAPRKHFLVWMSCSLARRTLSLKIKKMVPFTQERLPGIQ